MYRSLIVVLACLMPLAAGAAPLSATQKSAVDETVAEWLAETGAPSVSIAIVSGNEIAYAKAYGHARLHPRVPATTETRYEIGSISKQFTAAAVLLLQERGELSIDDKVAKYFPALASADKVSIRQLLGHTAGYRDCLPQDFQTPAAAKPITETALLKEWGTKPLDFVPGTKWQYSNTDFHIAGAIVEKVSGEPLFAFLQRNIFRPLRITDVLNDDSAPAPAMDIEGYTRYGNGPVRVAPKTAPGWRLGAGGLVMTSSDLALWYISLMDRSLLSARSYDALYTSAKLVDGSDTNYSLGLDAWHNDFGRLGLGHDGGGSGSRADSRAWPTEKIAIVALSNEDWAMAESVVDRLATIVLPPTPIEAKARALFDGFRKGTVDRALLSANANAYLTPAVLADQKAGLAPLGPVRTFLLDDERERGGMTARTWKIVTTKARLDAVERTWPNGRIEQFIVTKAE